MKERDRALVGALVVSQIVSLFWLALLSLGFSESISGDIGQIPVVVLRLNGVLFAFASALFSFLLSRLEVKFTKYAFLYGTTAFVSFFFAILFGFISLLSGEEANPIVHLVPISFTLTGIFVMIVFFVVVGFGIKGDKP